jgi:hypothetical protein
MGAIVPISGGTPGTQVVVSGTTILNGIACLSATTCEAVGQNSSNQGVVVPITSGSPGTVVPVAGTTILEGVACPSSATCEAVGFASSGGGVFVPITNGSPGAAVSVPGTGNLGGVACPSSATCDAVGYAASGGGVFVPITNGSPGAAVSVPGTGNLAGVACPTTATCDAVGLNPSSSEGVVAVIPGDTSTPSVAVTPTSGPPATAVTITGTRFLPGETVRVTYQTGLISPASVVLCKATALGDSSFSCPANIPAKPTAGAKGAHKIVAKGLTSLIKAKTTFTRT